MPVITFFQTKGGTGKTTSAFLLAEFIARETPVTVIDADPNQPFTAWQKAGGKTKNFTVVNEISEERIIDTINKAAAESTFVIIDTEGTANLTAAHAASASDLVIVTTRGKPLDQAAAAKAIKFVKDVGKRAGRQIPIRVLMTCTPAAARSRTLRAAEEDMHAHGIQSFSIELTERDAFAALFGYGSTLFDLDRAKVGGVDKAYFNAKAYALEVARVLQDLEAEGQGRADQSPDLPTDKAVA